ncbi:MAG: flagellar filament capping protein FliD [Chloroflexi bacterium]|nr:flagellar filament capping protein FliD [Chloroflexota bacterium]
MASGDFAIPGLMSGLSTTDIITKIMDAERLPLQRMQNRKDDTQKKMDAIRDINTRLASLLSKIQSLNIRSTVDAKSVTTDTPSSSAAIVTATANSDAALGSFTIQVSALSTYTSVVTAAAGGAAAAIGAAVQTNQPLASAGFGITPTTGTFSVNGATITIDSSTVLSDGTDLDGANTIVAKVRVATAAVGNQVNVSIVNDAVGRPNKLRFTAADGSTAIQLGAGADTSNFLTAAGLASQPSTVTMTGSRNLGAVKASATLSSSEANLPAGLVSSGTFKINGVEISYDATTDTLNGLLSRINSSSANVTASYDAISDRVTLTAKASGGAAISLQDGADYGGAGNFLSMMKLSTANEAYGTNAEYYLNGSAQASYSSSNTVTDAVTGVTINLKKADPTTTVTVSVSQDTSSSVKAVQDFVTQFNSALTFIRDKTAYDATTKKASILTGDPTVLGIDNTLRLIAGGAGVGLSSAALSLADIGITTGAIGSTPGSTDALVLDTSKLTEKLQSNSSAVADVFGALAATTNLAGGGTGSIASVSGTPDKHTSGTYSIVSDASGNLTATFTPTAGSPVTSTGTIAAGSTNTTLIPGLILTANAMLASGTDTVTTTITQLGVGTRLADYLESLTSSTGILANKQDDETNQINDINDSIQRLQERLDRKEESLYARFRGLEVALARLQGQSSAVAAQISKLSSSS